MTSYAGWNLYFKDDYSIIAIDSSKQQTLDAGPKAIQQTNFTGNLNIRKGMGWRWGWVQQWFSLLKNKKNILNFSQGIVKIL